MRVPAVADQVATVRHAILDSAKAHGIGRAPRNDIALAVSEACTNVVLHAYLGAAARAPSPSRPIATTASSSSSSATREAAIRPRTDSPGLGLGLGLIGRLTQRLEIASNEPVGATITMVFTAPGEPPPT